MDLDFHGYTDADWGGCNDTSKSTSGFVFISSRGAIGWSSKRQSMVSLSSTESEYIGLTNAGQHLAWLRSFFEELGRPQAGATELRCGNRAAIILSQDAQFRARTKHIQRKYHYVCDGLVATGECVVLWYPTDEMVGTSSPRHYLTRSISSSAKVWDYGQTRVGVSEVVVRGRVCLHHVKELPYW